jgi:hypothetical protein
LGGALQLDRFGEHATGEAWSEHALGADVDVSANEVTRVHDEAAEIEQASARLEIDEEVDIGPVVRLAARHGAEHPDS